MDPAPMPIPPLSERDLKQVPALINAASAMMQAAWQTYAHGPLTPEMCDAVRGVQADMGRFLAYFEDGAGFSRADPGSVASMRNVEMMASQLLEDIEIDSGPPSPPMG